MIRLDFQDSRPIYEQIMDYYKRMILIGVMEEDEQMPSVRQLAMDLSTNPNTVQKAFTELEREGYIYTVRGRGSFVHASENLRLAKRQEMTDTMKNWIREAREMGFSPRDIFEQTLAEIEKGGNADD